MNRRNFRLHWASTAIVQTGSFFTLVAMPWLVMAISDDDPIAVTTVMATMTLPQGLCILLGGTLADRFSPLRLLFVSRIAFVAAMASFALLVFCGKATLTSVYLYALLLGTLGGIGVPAAQALLPAMLEKSELGRANGLVMGTMQVTQVVGPILAGWLIWLGKGLQQGASASADVDQRAVAFAFAVDAAAVATAIALMSAMKLPQRPQRTAALLPAFLQGLRFCWRDRGIRLVLAYLVLISFFLQGPMLASLPLYTKLTLGLAEAAYGTLYATMGLGTIVGAAVAVWSAPDARKLGSVVLCCDFLSGAGFNALGSTGNPWLAGGLLFAMGICAGVIMVAGMTWFQQRTPEQYMGRVMGLLMFSIVGLMPLSASLTGYLINSSSVGDVMRIAGSIVVVVSAIGLLLPAVRSMGDPPALTAEQKNAS